MEKTMERCGVTFKRIFTEGSREEDCDKCAFSRMDAACISASCESSYWMKVGKVTQETGQSKDDPKSWSFRVKSPIQIDTSTVEKSLSPKRPVILVKMEGQDKVMILVHNTLWLKIGLYGTKYERIQALDVLQKESCAVIKTTEKDMGLVFKFLRNLKKESFPTKGESVVTVKYVDLV